MTALTRPETASVFPAGVTTKNIDYTSHSSLVSALQGQDILIITMSVMAPPDQEPALIRAAAEAGIKWIMPNEWGNDYGNPALAKDLPIFAQRVDKIHKLIEDLGVSSWLVVTSGFWYEFSLAGTEWRYGFDIKERKVTFYSDGTQRINTTTWPQIGRALAALLSFKILPDDENDKSEAVISKFKNKRCYISSFLVNQKDMWESLMRVTGTKESDWTVKYEDVEERYKRGIEMLQKGDRTGFGIAMYARDFFPDGSGAYETTRGLSNELLGLPKENLDEFAKIAVDRVNTIGPY